jgi:Ni,Fe-hydrogenase maturation factor
VQQLTPECAEEISGFDRVIFLDADAAHNLTHAAIQPVSAMPSRSPLTHASTPAEIVALSKALFGFTGEALVCRIPAHDFSLTDHLTQDGQRLVNETAARLECFL